MYLSWCVERSEGALREGSAAPASAIDFTMSNGDRFSCERLKIRSTTSPSVTVTASIGLNTPFSYTALIRSLMASPAVNKVSHDVRVNQRKSPDDHARPQCDLQDA